MSSVAPVIFLTYQCQVWQFAQTLAFVQYSLPLVADWVGTIAGLTAQLDITSPQEFAVHPAPRLGRFDCKNTWESEIFDYKRATNKQTFILYYIGTDILFEFCITFQPFR